MITNQMQAPTLLPQEWIVSRPILWVCNMLVLLVWLGCFWTINAFGLVVRQQNWPVAAHTASRCPSCAPLASVHVQQATTTITTASAEAPANIRKRYSKLQNQSDVRGVSIAGVPGEPVTLGTAEVRHIHACVTLLLLLLLLRCCCCLSVSPTHTLPV